MNPLPELPKKPEDDDANESPDALGSVYDEKAGQLGPGSCYDPAAGGLPISVQVL